MDRSLWTQTLTKQSCPAWTCRACGRGTLALVKDSLVDIETSASTNARGDENWDPDWLTYTFVCWVKCGNALCSDQVVVTGTGGVEMSGASSEDGYAEEWNEYFRPNYCSMMPDIIRFPAKCPDDVMKQLRASFALFWADEAAAANRLRAAVECLMDHAGIPKLDKKGVPIPLHGRIESFATREPAAGMQLMALKWLGNTGSHVGDVSRNDMLDAYEVFEHALAEIIDRRSQKVAELARSLADKHAPKKAARISKASSTSPPNP